MRFAKYEGLGNDFVVVDERVGARPATPVAVRRALCDRHRGVGADGVITVLAPRHAGAIARMHITNADGSVPEMCGNGLRCVSLFLVHEGLVAWGGEHVVDTDAGPRRATVLRDDAPRDDVPRGDGPTDMRGRALVRVDMGPARFAVPGQIPSWSGERIEVAGVTVRASTVSMGNPHLVLELEHGQPDLELARRVGPLLETNPRFPERTNVELIALRTDGSVDVIVWERGVGITEACGTGACGVAAVLARAGRIATDEEVMVHLPGGPLAVRVPADAEGPVWMTGPARRVFVGDVEAEGLVAPGVFDA